jgi:methylated-DNA-protein-cysteine methyltransferase-like protein
MFSRIHAVILKIPPGKVSTYGAVARAAGFPGAARQVVWALRQGKALPWHRVVGSGGRIALPGEAGFEQRLRLESEGVLFSGSRVNMKECEHRLMEWKNPKRATRARTAAERIRTGRKKRRS